MAPYKLEENIKEKLEKRKLNPTDSSWETLTNRLDAQQARSKYKYYRWLSIAAIILVLLSVGIFNFNSGIQKTDLPVIVNTDNDNSTDITDRKESNSNEINGTQLNMDSDTGDEVVEISSKETRPDKNLSEIMNDFSDKSKEVAQSDDKVEIQSIKDNPKKSMLPQSIESDLESAKINEVVAELKKLQINNTSVSDKEIDSLLKAAHRELLIDKINESKTITVDADALLFEVEQDIESSFRSKVFEALKDSYNTIKTSVAERNN